MLIMQADLYAGAVFIEVLIELSALGPILCLQVW